MLLSCVAQQNCSFSVLALQQPRSFHWRLHPVVPCSDAGPPLCCVCQALAVDISLAALLGEDVYNFGELLLHPIVSAERACLLSAAVSRLPALSACVPIAAAVACIAHARPRRREMSLLSTVCSLLRMRPRPAHAHHLPA